MFSRRSRSHFLLVFLNVLVIVDSNKKNHQPKKNVFALVHQIPGRRDYSDTGQPYSEYNDMYLQPAARYPNSECACRNKVSKESQAGTTLATGRPLKDPFGSLLSLQEEEVAVS